MLGTESVLAHLALATGPHFVTFHIDRPSSLNLGASLVCLTQPCQLSIVFLSKIAALSMLLNEPPRALASWGPNSADWPPVRQGHSSALRSQRSSWKLLDLCIGGAEAERRVLVHIQHRCCSPRPCMNQCNSVHIVQGDKSPCNDSNNLYVALESNLHASLR